MSDNCSDVIRSNKREFERKKMYLKRYLNLKRKIDRLTRRLNHLEQDDDVIFKDTQDQISYLEMEALIARKQVYLCIDRLDNDNETVVLEMFFVQGSTFNQIACELGYSERHVVRMYSSGLTNLAID